MVGNGGRKTSRNRTIRQTERGVRRERSMAPARKEEFISKQMVCSMRVPGGSPRPRRQDPLCQRGVLVVQRVLLGNQHQLKALRFRHAPYKGDPRRRFAASTPVTPAAPGNIRGTRQSQQPMVWIMRDGAPYYPVFCSNKSLLGTSYAYALVWCSHVSPIVVPQGSPAQPSIPTLTYGTHPVPKTAYYQANLAWFHEPSQHFFAAKDAMPDAFFGSPNCHGLASLDY
jgi:hypothetical protein